MVLPFNNGWPAKYDLLGVRVSAATYDDAVEAIARAARHRHPAIVSLHAVHALVTTRNDALLLDAVNRFDMVAPDGQPVRWALNWLHGTRLGDRVYGPELMLRLCGRAARDAIPVYLYGSTPAVIDALCRRLPARYPGLTIAGAESPPFRVLTPEEDDAMVQRINASGAGMVFVGLGAPKQDWFAHEHSGRIAAVQVCVGAAFDFHAGAKPMAPAWMQRTGLEWLFRFYQEPHRLWKRYLVTNTVLLGALGHRLLRHKVQRLFRACRLRWWKNDRKHVEPEQTDLRQRRAGQGVPAAASHLHDANGPTPDAPPPRTAAVRRDGEE